MVYSPFEWHHCSIDGVPRNKVQACKNAIKDAKKLNAIFFVSKSFSEYILWVLKRLLQNSVFICSTSRQPYHLEEIPVGHREGGLSTHSLTCQTSGIDLSVVINIGQLFSKHLCPVQVQLVCLWTWIQSPTLVPEGGWAFVACLCQCTLFPGISTPVHRSRSWTAVVRRVSDWQS